MTHLALTPGPDMLDCVAASLVRGTFSYPRPDMGLAIRVKRLGTGRKTRSVWATIWPFCKHKTGDLHVTSSYLTLEYLGKIER